MTALEFGPAHDITTGIMDKTPRVAFTVNGNVVVQVATAQPAEGWIAGKMFPQYLTRMSDEQRATLRALGVVDPSGLEVDVPCHLWERFIQRLRSVGAPV